MPKTHPATRDEIIELLLAHRTLGEVPRPELEWLADHGTLRDYEVGDVFVDPTVVPTEMLIIFEGDGSVFVERAGEKEEVHGVARRRRHRPAPVLEDEARPRACRRRTARSSDS